MKIGIGTFTDFVIQDETPGGGGHGDPRERAWAPTQNLLGAGPISPEKFQAQFKVMASETTIVSEA